MGSQCIYTSQTGYGCPYCSGRKTVQNLNGLLTKHSDIAAQWHPTKNSGTNLVEVAEKSGKKAWWLCAEGHEWEAAVYSRTNGHGCPYCAGVRPISGETDLSVTHPYLIEEWHPTKNTTLFSEASQGSDKLIWWKGSCNHEWETTISNKVKGKQCPFCTNRQVFPGFNDLSTTHPTLVQSWHPTKNNSLPETLSAGSGKKVWWLCDKGHEWEAYVYSRAGRVGSSCPECWASTYVSKAEQELYDFLTSLGLDVVQSDRKALGNRQEIDLFIPEANFGIEFNGVYYHNEYWKPKNYHKDKHDTAKAAGIQLLQIWEDDWQNRKPVILRALAHKLGKTSQLTEIRPELHVETNKVFARKTKVMNLSTGEASKFLEQNHVQGFASGSYYLGLKDAEGVLRALMVLKKEAGETLNIIRYATAGSVTGGFTKLLKHATREYQPSAFITFADHTISDGGLYENNGFVVDKELPPDYMYVVKGERKHKFGYRLKKFRDDPNLLWDENLSERELALLNNIPRIWDAGKTRYRYAVKT